MKPVCHTLLPAVLLASSVGVSSATAEIVATRQVSTADISPTIYAQVNNGGAFNPIGSTQFYNTQLFTPVVDNGSLAFITSSHQGTAFIPYAIGEWQSGLYLIDDLTPQLHTDGTTNLNVTPIAHGLADPAVGAFDNGPAGAGRAVGFDFRPNALSLSGGSVSVFTSQQGTLVGTRLGLYEGTTTTATTAPVSAMGVIADENTSLLAGATFDAGAVYIPGLVSEAHSFARDGDRTLTIASMQDGRHVLMSHDNGVRTNLLVSGGGAAGIDLPDVAFHSSYFLDAADGQFAIIANNSRIYQFDTNNNATLLATSGGQRLSYLSFDGQDVVVGRHADALPDAFNPTITTRARGGRIYDDTQFLGAGLNAISRVENGTLVDLVNLSTEFPDDGPAFAGLGPFSYSEGNLAFLGSSTDRAGLFVLYNDELHKVLEIGDTFDGKTVMGVDINRQGLDGDLLAFVVTFGSTETTEGYIEYDQSIYTMSLAGNFFVPEPGSLAVLGMGSLALFRRRRRGH